MNFKYQLMSKNKFDKGGLKKFIMEVNFDLPIPITDKIDIDVFLDKIRNFGEAYCVYDQEKIIGCAFFYANDKINKQAFLTLFAVKREYRNCGIGSILLEHMIDYCDGLGFEYLQLYTHKTNKKARSFYSRKYFYEIDCDRENDVKLELKLGRSNGI